MVNTEGDPVTVNFRAYDIFNTSYALIPFSSSEDM